MAFLAVREHAGHERLDAVDDAPDVDGEAPAPVVQRQLPHRHVFVGADAGVVAEHVDLAEGCDGAALELDHGFEARDVGDDADRAWRHAMYRGDGAVERGLLDVGEHDVRAFAGEALGDREPDAAGAAGDDGGLSLEVLHAARSSDLDAVARGVVVALVQERQQPLAGNARSTLPLLWVVPSSYSILMTLRTGTSATGSSGES